MDATKFVSPKWGRAVSTGGTYAYVRFLPTTIPRALTFEPATINLLSEADAALGRLSGAGRLLPNPHLLLTPFVRREALASSRIEGTQASLSDVFEAEARGVSGSLDVREVTNYVAALDHGLARLGALPISGRLAREMHRVLLRGVRGGERTPGEFRTSQNWIGSSDGRIESAIYVPPTPDEIPSLLVDWERFVHDAQPQLPLLIRTALLHYQFETIHPFLDGNGRLGRLLIVLYLVERGALPTPLLPLSPYFERNRSSYYDCLQGVRERGDIQAWLRFFLRGVATQARDAITRSDGLLNLRERYRLSLQGSRSRAPEVIDLLLATPILTSRQVSQRLPMSTQGALNLLRQLTAAGILREDSSGRGSLARWYADEVLELLAD